MEQSVGQIIIKADHFQDESLHRTQEASSGKQDQKENQCCKLKLNDSPTSTALLYNLESQLAEFLAEGSAEEDWQSFRDIVHTTSEQLLGYPTHNQQDLFEENDDDVQALLAEKHRLHRAYQSDPSSTAKEECLYSCA